MKNNEEIFQKESKKSKLIIYVLLLTLLVNVVFYGLMRQNAKDEFQQVGIALTKEVSQSLKIWVNEQRKMASIISISSPITEWIENPDDVENQEKVSRYLRLVISRYHQFENVSINRLKKPDQPWLNPNTGKYELDCYRVGSDPQSIVKFEDTETVEPILEGKSYYLSSIVKSSITGKPIFYFSIPITRNNEILGMITFSIKMSYFTESIIEPIKYRDTGYLFFIDDRGETIAHANSSYILSDATYLTDIVNQLLSPLKLGENYFRGRFQGAWKHYYGVSFGLDSEYVRNQWYLVFTEHESELYQQTNRYLLVMSLTSFILITLLMFNFNRIDRYRSKVFLETHEQLEKELLEEKLKQKNNEIVRQINLDQLTGISHFQSIQRYLEHQITEAEASGKTFTLALFHVDKLGAFNQSEGYALGDVVLNLIGRLLKDTYALPNVTGRLYGDVFGIVFTGKTLIESIVLVEQFRSQYETQMLSLIPRKPSLSFGLVQWQNETASEMILKAEALLKQCKEDGQRQIKY